MQDLKDQVIRKLSEREHILKRSGMYLGSTSLTKTSEYIIEDGKFVYKEVEYVPGLIKIFNELIDNSLDEHQRTGGKFATKIDITLNNTEFSVSDNGRGIPVVKSFDENGKSVFQPELAWTHARAGSNFEDENKTSNEQATIGTNGVGSMIASVFSKSFVGTTDDGKNSCTVSCKNNNESVITKVTQSKRQGTKVTIEPDLARFSLNEIDDIHIQILVQRIHILSVSYPGITFKINGKLIRLNSKQFISMFGDSVEDSGANYTLAFLPNIEDDFRHYTLLNGLTLRKGGSHVNLILYNVVARLRDKLSKKYKDIKPGDIRNKLFFVSVFNKFPNAKWDGQTKEELANSASDITEYLGNIDYDKIVAKILKTPAIIDAITEIYRIKEEFKKQQLLKSVDKKTKQKPKSEKFMSPIGKWDNILLCEGDSAANSISKIIGRQGNGFFAMFGVPPNAYDTPTSDIIKSKKMIELKDILGLQFSKKTQDDINFKNIIITTDFDLPGHFIAGQLLGLLYRYGKNLFEEKRIMRLVTPLIIVKDKKEEIITWFYDFEKYSEYEKKNKSKNYLYEYKKGLGSLTQEEMEKVISTDGLENMLEVFFLDDMSEDLIDAWLNGTRAQSRKDMLEGYAFNIMNS